MARSQDLNPLDLALTEVLGRTSTMTWTETVPGRAWAKVLWAGAESGAWAAMIRWKKGYDGPAHKHLASSHTFVMCGQLQLDDNVYIAGDYVYEPAGIIQRIARAVDDRTVANATTALVCTDADGRPRRLPTEVKERLAELAASVSPG